MKRERERRGGRAGEKDNVSDQTGESVYECARARARAHMCVCVVFVCVRERERGGRKFLHSAEFYYGHAFASSR